MTLYYELATLSLPFGAAAQAAAAVHADTTSKAARGQLLGCWTSDIGSLNQMWVLRSFASADDLLSERQRNHHSSDPLGCGAIALSLEQHSYRGFDWMPPVQASAESGLVGPVYEIRTYGIKPGGVQITQDLWQQAMPARAAVSPCVIAMIALDGPLRFTNIWAYPSLNARSQARAEAVAQGIWPPKGGPAWLTTTMSSTIALPTPVSPLQ